MSEIDIGIGEIAVILVVALLVFGPDRLPAMIKQAASFIGDLRTMVANARKDLSGSIGDLGLDAEDIKTLTDLRNPKSYLRQKVLDGADPSELGLDEFEELGDELELNKNKRRRTSNGTGTRRTATPRAGSASTSGAGARASRVGSGSARSKRTATTTSDGEDTTVLPAGDKVAGNEAGSASGVDGAGDAGRVRATAAGARFDPDAT